MAKSPRFRPAAECNSAIQQTECLRYVRYARRRQQTESRLKVCDTAPKARKLSGELCATLNRRRRRLATPGAGAPRHPNALLRRCTGHADHPTNAEAILHHAKAGRPERLCQWHLHLPTV